MSVFRRRPLTTVYLYGRFGNQLFQYAAGLQMRGIRGGRVRFIDRLHAQPTELHLFGLPDTKIRDTGLLDVRNSHAYLRSLLHRMFPVFGGILWPVQRRIRNRLHRWRLAERRRNVIRAWHPFREFVEAEQTRSVRHLVLSGYFQHPSWFEPVLEEVTASIWPQISSLAAPLIDKGATVISVRRGDYLTLGWDLDLEYYGKALDALGRFEGPIWITSDDPAAGDLLEPILRSRGLAADAIPDIGATQTVRDFVVLCSARSIIMSNSTFCWWGTVTGELAGNQSPKTVIAPATWLPDWSDSEVLLRPRWTLIESTYPNCVERSSGAAL